MGYDHRITDIAAIAAVAAGKNASVAPQLLTADFTFTVADAVKDGRLILGVPAGDPKALDQRCTEIADKAVPAYRSGERHYACTGHIARKWEAAWNGACIALGGDPGAYPDAWRAAYPKVAPPTLAPDVITLVIACRELMDVDVIDGHPDFREERAAFERAVEAFSSRVCYEDDGDNLLTHADPCTCGRKPNE